MAIEGLDPDEHRRITKSARHYGFHATLKAPFILREDRTVQELKEEAQAFAKERSAFLAPALIISALSRWTAFTLSKTSPDMNQLAADCVQAFEPFREALSEADIKRRRQSGLSPRQDQQMLAFGYPYIFEDFHFHMTLAGPLEPDQQQTLVEKLRPQAAMIETTPLKIDAIALYEQPDRETPFQQTERFPFGS